MNFMFFGTSIINNDSRFYTPALRETGQKKRQSSAFFGGTDKKIEPYCQKKPACRPSDHVRAVRNKDGHDGKNEHIQRTDIPIEKASKQKIKRNQRDGTKKERNEFGRENPVLKNTVGAGNQEGIHGKKGEKTIS